MPGAPAYSQSRARCYHAGMLQAVGAIVFLVLAYTVVALLAERLPPNWASGVALLVPLIGGVAAAFARPVISVPAS